MVQSQVRFIRILEKVPEKVRVTQSQVRFNKKIPEKVPEKILEKKQKSGEGSGRLWYRARQIQ